MHVRIMPVCDQQVEKKTFISTSDVIITILTFEGVLIFKVHTGI